MKPYFTIGVFFLIIVVIFNSVIKPNVNHVYNLNLQKAYMQAAKNLFANNKFFSIAREYTFYVNNSDSKNQKFDKIMIEYVNHSKDKVKINNVYTFAKSGRLIETKNDKLILLNNGHQLISYGDDEYLLDFESYIPHISTQVGQLNSLPKDISTLSNSDLLVELNEPENRIFSKKQINSELKERFFTPLTYVFITVIFLIIVFRFNGNKSHSKNKFKFSISYKWQVMISFAFMSGVIFYFLYLTFSEIDFTFITSLTAFLIIVLTFFGLDLWKLFIKPKNK